MEVGEIISGGDPGGSAMDFQDNKSNSISPLRDSSEERTVQSFLNLESESNTGSSASMYSSETNDAKGSSDRYPLRGARRRSSRGKEAQSASPPEGDSHTSSSENDTRKSRSTSGSRSDAAAQDSTSSKAHSEGKRSRRKGE